MSSQNRESWLHVVAEKLAPRFASAGFPLKSGYRVSVGFPSTRALSRRNQAVGQCFPTQVTADGSGMLFISPVLNESTRVIDVLAHELVHHTVGCEAGHKGAFAQCAKGIGLEGKMTATVASDAFKQFATAIV